MIMENLTDRQSQIVSESINLIAEMGIQGLTIKNLAKKIEVSEPAIYRHFSSKMDILLAILDSFKQDKQVSLSKIASNRLSSLKKLEAIYTHQFSTFTQNPALAAVIFSEEIFTNDKRLSRKVYEIMDTKQQILRTILEDGQRNLEIRDEIPAEQMALVIMGSLRLLVTQWRMTRFSFSLEEKGNELWRSIERMISLD